MFDNIKNKHSVKAILNHTCKKKKLDLIKYNKKLQIIVDININDYKFFSKYYIIFDENGIGRVYNNYNDNLVFEGEYLRGIKNGKGKEYYENGKLKFEGNYLKGKKNGQGKEYNKYGLLKFEGEYLNDKKYNGKIRYYKMQELKEGKGYIKEYKFLKLEYEGEYLNGERNGPGKEYYNNGKIKFEGEFLNNKQYNGKGYDKENNLVYELKNGNGFIKEYDYNGNFKFEGILKDGKKNGHGKEYYCDGKLKFEGNYLNDEKDGPGKEYYYYNKLKFEGNYSRNKKEGKEYNNDGGVYEGEFLFGRKWNGKEFDKNHKIIYELINGNGKVKEYDSDGQLKYEGE